MSTKQKRTERLEPEYLAKYQQVISQIPLYASLCEEEKRQLSSLALMYRLSHQEVRILVDIIIDLAMWGKPSFFNWLENHFETKCDPSTKINLPQKKHRMFENINQYINECRTTLKSYTHKNTNNFRVPDNQALSFIERSEKQNVISGRCPAYSDKTRCCGLITLDAVENCLFNCHYCCIQSFYPKNTYIVDSQLEKKLDMIELDPHKFYRVGTGQSSDALIWENRFEILDKLCHFAQTNPNVLLELKTKSNRIDYLLNHQIPANVCVSFSLNPQRIIDQEELGTASLEERLNAAFKLTEKGILVGFHFHPMIYYDRWESDYTALFQAVYTKIPAKYVAFVSFGTLTFAKPILANIRKRRQATQILQMPFVNNPEGKLTYPSDIKIKMFRLAYESFAVWHSQVFFYLCMEESRYWQEAFGWDFSSNSEFEDIFANRVRQKINFKSTFCDYTPLK